MEAYASGSKQANTEDLGTLPFAYVERQVLGSLAKGGHLMPSRKALKETLEHGLEPLVLRDCSTSVRRPWSEVSFVHLVNLVWEPLCAYIESLVAGRSAQWSSALSKHVEALILEMQGLVQELDTPLIIDDWLEYVQDTLKRLVDVTMPRDVLFRSLGSIVPLTLAPTRFHALSMLRTHACSSMVVGQTLATQLSRRVRSEIAELPVTLMTQ